MISDLAPRLLLETRFMAVKLVTDHDALVFMPNEVQPSISDFYADNEVDHWSVTHRTMAVLFNLA